MPEQASKRGEAITTANFQAPFETHLVRLGAAGLNLKDELDVIPETQFSRLTNVDHDTNGALTSRPGQTSFATAGTLHHSVRRFSQPAGTDTRIWGIDSSLYRGASGVLTLIEGGYSGDPLSLAPHRPALSGDPWLFVGDKNKMRKVRADGLILPIGLPAPTVAATAVLGTEYQRRLAEFDATDGTNAAAWTPTAGTDENGHPAGIPSAVDEASSPAGNDVSFTTNSGSIDSAYDSWLGIALSRDLSTLIPVGGGASIPASDDDLVHLWMKTSDPKRVKEVRVYIVVSATFNPAILPGKDASANTDAYVKSFRQNDFVQFIQAAETQIDAAETARIFALRDQDLADRAIGGRTGTSHADGSTPDNRASWAIPRAGQDPARARSVQIGTGGHQWFELGAIGLALRRGDFQRIGNTAGRDWATVTGLVVYMKQDITPTDHIISWAMDDLYLTGGFGLDTADPGQQPYDWRYTHYDPRTGAESNGSPISTSANTLDSLRRQVNVTPAANGDGSVRQRFYRRGGSLVDDWFFEGTNASDGGVFTATLTDDALSAAGTLPIDHFQPVPTVDASGATVLAQPIAALWGPIDGMLLACGDPHRPGHLYWSLPDSPDHWSADSTKEICPPSEELMAGGVLGTQAFVWSRLRLYLLYPSLTGDATIDYQPSLCKRGIQQRTAFCVGPGGIYFYAEGEGIFVTSGGPEDWLSRDIDPIFQGVTRYGYLPLDPAVGAAIRLTVWENKLYFGYQDVSGARQIQVYHILQKFWRHYTPTRATAALQGEDEEELLLGGLNSGATYTHTGTLDDGATFPCTARTGAMSGGRREEKLFGDAMLDADVQGVAVSVQHFLNEESVANLPQTITPGAGRQRYLLDAFGTTPQAAHSISTEFSWTAGLTAPQLYQVGYALTVQPEATRNRMTNWDDLGTADEFWLSGVTFDVDTGGVARTVIIERDFNGTVDTVATLTVTTAGRRKLAFSWAAVSARKVRIRPTDDTCKFWLLYRADWIYHAEPPRIAAWDAHFENEWDQYYTGLDLYCDTGGLTKQVEVYVDETRLNDPATGLGTFPVTASGRRVVHLTLPWGRGHVFRFRAIDVNPGLLYSHRWQLTPEPSEQANWNQPFSILGSRADKWLKAVVFECDTFGQNKSVTVEADGVIVETLTVNASGRKSVQLALSQERLGRVWRFFPTDGNPGRLYSLQPVFDEEPFQLTRWETQEINYGLPGWFSPLYATIVLRSTQPVTVTLQRQYNQRGGTRIDTYVIPATGGVKVPAYLTFEAGRDVSHKWILTSPAAFFLYRDESVWTVQPWGAADPIRERILGNSGEDRTRNMVNSFAAATTSGGTADDQR